MFVLGFIMEVYEEELGKLILETLCSLVNGNSANANIFRQTGGTAATQALLPYLQCRDDALSKWI